MTGLILDVGQVLQIPRISQGVYVDDLIRWMGL
jgi:hypothetical protein